MAPKRPQLQEDIGRTNALLFGDGSTTQATLDAALTAIGATEQELILPPVDRDGTLSPWVLTTNTTTARNITLRIPASTQMSIPPGVTLTVDGPLVAETGEWWDSGGTVNRRYPAVQGRDAYVVEGAFFPVPASSVTFAPELTRAWVKESATLWPVHQLAVSLTLPTTDATYWLAVYRDTVTLPAGWTRPTVGEHYLFQAAGTQPVDPEGGLVLCKVVVAGGIITASTPFAYRAAVDASTRTHYFRSWGAPAATSALTVAAMQQAIEAASITGKRAHLTAGVYPVESVNDDMCLHIGVSGFTLTGDGDSCVIKTAVNSHTPL